MSDAFVSSERSPKASQTVQVMPPTLAFYGGRHDSDRVDHALAVKIIQSSSHGVMLNVIRGNRAGEHPALRNLVDWLNAITRHVKYK